MTDLNELFRLLEHATPGPWMAKGYVLVHRTDTGIVLIITDGNASLTPHDAALIAALRNAAEELIRDARRYRWLKHGDNDEKVLCRGPVDMSHVYLLREQKLDAAIDAAISQEQP